MTGRIVGILLCLLIVGGGVAYKFYAGEMGAKATVNGTIGGEKVNFLEDPQIQRVLKRKFGLEVTFSKAGSIEMVSAPPQAQDFLWPSSEVALEMFKVKNPGLKFKASTIFNTPIVMYSWDLVVKALEKGQFIVRQGDSLVVQELPRLMDEIVKGRSWESIGVPELYGKVSIFSTDPTKSNSGFVFAGLLASILTKDLENPKELEKTLAELKLIFGRLGYMESSSGDIFENYLRMGVGSKPIIVGYENQMVEFSLAHADVWSKVKDKVAILYPIPTVWSAHPLISLTENGHRLAEALADPEIQRLAWERHGFRTGMIGVQNDPKVLQISGIPEQIQKVIPMPSLTVMNQILGVLQPQSH